MIIKWFALIFKIVERFNCMNLEQHSSEIFIFYDIVFERHANSFGIMTESANEYNLRFLKTDLTHIHCCSKRLWIYDLWSFSCISSIKARDSSDLNARARDDREPRVKLGGTENRVIYDDMRNKTIIGKDAFCATRYEYWTRTRAFVIIKGRLYTILYGGRAKYIALR